MVSINPTWGMAVVCLSLVIVSGVAFAERARVPGTTNVHASLLAEGTFSDVAPALAAAATSPIEKLGPEVTALASDSASSPALTFLHGMCMNAEATCHRLDGAAGALGLIVCPHGNAQCGGASDWKGDGAEKAAFLDEAFSDVERAFGSGVSPRNKGVIVGFSRGAFVARDVIYERPGYFRGAILVGAALSPDAERFRKAGIERVVLAAGDFDGARPTMEKAAVRLTALGIPTKFVRLGPIPHALPKDFDRIVTEAVQWIDARDET